MLDKISDIIPDYWVDWVVDNWKIVTIIMVVAILIAAGFLTWSKYLLDIFM